ncbi:MAG: serine O-acetyltransferase [Leptospiraceae bacterium]|nr:serine O-acetyltransferase [Leptospiraceae bacterium]
MFENIKFIKQNDPAAKSYLEIVLCYPGLHALWLHKIAHELYNLKLSLIPRLINYFSRFLTGIDIHPGAKIASGILIDHGTGVVIGETAEIGKGCLIYQGVTLGGTGKEDGKRHPTLKDNIVIGAGAKVLGNIIIGSNVRIGAGSVVMQNVPPNCTVVGIPGRVVRSTNDAVSDNNILDHASLPDPVTRIISILVEKVDTLQREIVNISKSDRTQKATEKLDLEINQFIGGGGI